MFCDFVLMPGLLVFHYSQRHEVSGEGVLLLWCHGLQAGSSSPGEGAEMGTMGGSCYRAALPQPLLSKITLSKSTACSVEKSCRPQHCSTARRPCPWGLAQVVPATIPSATAHPKWPQFSETCPVTLFRGRSSWGSRYLWEPPLWT